MKEGGKLGVRVALARAQPEVVKGLVKQAWRRKAPKALAVGNV